MSSGGDVMSPTRRSRVLLVHLATPRGSVPASPYVLLQAFPQLGLLYLAAALRDAGFDPEYLDTTLREVDAAALLEELSHGDVLFVGFYATIFHREDVCRLIRSIKRRFRTPVLVGGPGFFEADHYFEAGADAVVRGEAEGVIHAIASRLQHNQSLEGLDGVVLPGTRAESVAPSPPQGPNALPRPAWDLAQPAHFYNHLGLQSRHPFGCVVASRGCPMRCAFCSKTYRDGANSYRLRDAEDVIEEMAELHTRYGVRHIKFQDDSFGADRGWLERFCRRYDASGLPMTWNCSVFPGLFKKDPDDLLRLVRRARCVSIHFGLQSASPEILRNVQRSPDEPDLLLRLLPTMKRMGFYTLIDFIYGLPGETEQTLANNLRFALRSGVHMAQFNPLCVVPDTPLHERFGDRPVNDLAPMAVERAIEHSNRAFLMRPVIWRESLSYVIRHNPRYLATLVRLTPFAAKLGLGRFEAAQWKASNRTRGSGTGNERRQRP